MIFFYIPFLYFIKSRFSSNLKVLSWLLIYFVPLFIITGGVNYINFILMCTLVYTLYEIGYIQNDAETIKKEKNPTERLSKHQLSYYEFNKANIYTFRFLLSFLICYYLTNNGVSFVYLTFLITPVFFIYNHIRSRFSLLVHFLLVCLRFSLPVLLLSNSIVLFFISILLFPFINTFERSGEKRFNYRRSISFQHKYRSLFRVLYYGFLFMVFFLFSFYVEIEPSILYAFFYMMIYRFITFKMSSYV